MATVAAECPVCHATNEYAGETIGRYTLCPSCGARFYVEVPELADSKGELVIAEPKAAVPPSKRATTPDDAPWDTPKGARDIIQAIRRQEARAKTTRWLIAALLLLGLANLAGIVLLLLRL